MNRRTFARASFVAASAAATGCVRKSDLAARRVVAVDSDVEALRRLAGVLAERGLMDRFERTCSGFLDVAARGDVVLFEFSLHEMLDPESALARFGELAAESTRPITDVRGTEADKSEKARKVGALIAERAKAAGVEQVVFDRAGNKYHGRIAALADAAREAGLGF